VIVMVKVSYDPKADAEAGLPENTTQFGYQFIGTKPVEVTNVQHLQKFAGNPHFKVHGTVPAGDNTVRTTAERESAKLGAGSQSVATGQEKPIPAIVPEPSQPQRPDKVTPGQADKPDGDSGLRAVHRHDDVFAVVDAADQDVLGGPLTGKQAEEFNSLSAKQKRAFIDNYPAEQKKAADKAAAEKAEEKKRAEALAAKARR
jgi:hypothetical protein